MDKEHGRHFTEFMETGIPFNKLLGIQVAKVEKGRVVMEIPFRDELVGDVMRPALHGGVIGTLIDTAGGCAVWSATEDVRNARVSTIDLRIDYLRPARLERIAAEAVVVRVGNRVGVVDVRVFHPGHESETIATGKGVYNVKRATAARDRA
jgi:uncharacterized protein (TIGR00369 family)